MNSPMIKTCERIAVIVSLLAVGLCLALGQPPVFTLGVLGGAALALFNFRLIRVLVTRTITTMKERGGQPGGLLIMALLFKVPLALAMVWLMINVAGLDPAGFGVGLSIIVGVLIFGPFIISLRGDDSQRVQALEATGGALGGSATTSTVQNAEES